MSSKSLHRLKIDSLNKHFYKNIVILNNKLVSGVDVVVVVLVSEVVVEVGLGLVEIVLDNRWQFLQEYEQ
jgi:hypothetical protein